MALPSERMAEAGEPQWIYYDSLNHRHANARLPLRAAAEWLRRLAEAAAA